MYETLRKRADWSREVPKPKRTAQQEAKRQKLDKDHELARAKFDTIHVSHRRKQTRKPPEGYTPKHAKKKGK